jgi:hypothetical protein
MEADTQGREFLQARPLPELHARSPEESNTESLAAVG